MRWEQIWDSLVWSSLTSTRRHQCRGGFGNQVQSLERYGLEEELWEERSLHRMAFLI